MKTTQETINSLFDEAVYFAKTTPASEFEKYLEYSKNFAKSFNRLIKKIDGAEERKEIVDWCIDNDCYYLLTEKLAFGLSIYEENNLKRNYGILKNHILNEIEIPKLKPNNDLSTLKELFVYPQTYESCIDVLKNVDPPILNVDNKFIGREKGAFVIWIDVLKKHNLVQRYSNDNLYSKLISNEFKPFSISPETFRKDPKRAKMKYETEFNILLSQVYQSVKSVN